MSLAVSGALNSFAHFSAVAVLSASSFLAVAMNASHFEQSSPQHAIIRDLLV
jgi:hypothetical protein